MNVLVVTNPFGGHGTGDCITDTVEIAAVKFGEHAHHVVTSEHAEPTTAPKAKTTKED